ncbi:MAG: hypothetical protein EZS28_007221 [Streblomastix strix]|uniref:Uncharacterized protein n=1 Tax=Streblomastix strix TaxID=222440 RepID=A0A5J4WT16_9EUKA|nr:MAG: hypothetical protein EZS28_007221 [Streblomastix strix]
MYESSWYDSGQLVPDQVTPASDELPLVDDTASAGISTSYSRGDHVHPLNVTTTISPQDSASGSVGTTNYYARNDHSHPINVETNASNIPIVDGVDANGTSAYYSRQDHVHPQQLTYDGNVIATQFIKSGGTANDILLTDGSTKQQSMASKLYQVVEQPLFIKLCTFIAYNASTDNSIEFQVDTRSGFGKIQFNQHWSNGSGISSYQYKFAPSLVTSLSSAWIIYFGNGVDRQGELWCLIDYYSYYTVIYQTAVGVFQGQITNILTTDGQTDLPTGYSRLTIDLSNESGAANRGLRISADGNTLSFNGSVIAGTGATSGSSNGSVNYSAGNPILWGLNSVDTNGGFYSDGPKIYWRAKPVTLGAVPP